MFETTCAELSVARFLEGAKLGSAWLMTEKTNTDTKHNQLFLLKWQK